MFSSLYYALASVSPILPFLTNYYGTEILRIEVNFNSKERFVIQLELNIIPNNLIKLNRPQGFPEA